MAPVSNEVLSGTSTQDSARNSRSSEPNTAGGLRADAVSLEVPVKVHGSRPGSAASQSERFEEQTSTMIVFPEGGVVRMASAVAAGQMLVLTNLKSRQDAICRVVKVRAFSDSQSYVEIEFTRPQTSYWGVYFASPRQPDPAPAPANAGTRVTQRAPEPTSTVILPPLPQEPSTPEVIENIADLQDTNPPVLPAPPAPSAKPVLPFALLGTQEKVQPAASATSVKLPSEGSKASHEIEDASAESPSKMSYARSARLGTFSSLRFEEDGPKGADPAETVSERMPAGSLADITSLADLDDVAAAANASPSGGSFGVRFDPRGASSRAIAVEPRQNWLLIAASIIVLVGAAAGGAWYFHLNFAKSAAPAPTNSAVQPTVPAQQPAAPVAIQQPAAQEPATTAASTPQSSASAPPIETAARNSASDTHPPAKPEPATDNSSEQLHLTVESSASPAPTSSAPTPVRSGRISMLSTSMKAHPLTSQRDISSAGDAPVVSGDGSSRDAGGLSSIGSSGVSVPPPPDATPQTAMSVGDAAKQPKLISSVMPVYPFSAREANVQGDVVIDTQIGANGSVTSMKVISGPNMLRQAALNALRRWKYQPSQLDGKPVAVQMLVTIRFRL